jgi:predicted RNA-binding protein with PUA-like domain
MRLMADWLFKTEPGDFSYDDLARKGVARWDGVTNALALIHLRRVAAGDRVLVYHTGKEKAIVGEARVVRGAYPDPAAGDPKRVVVDLEAASRWPSPLPLGRIRNAKELAGFLLLTNSRLSVMPVLPDERAHLERLARGD